MSVYWKKVTICFTEVKYVFYSFLGIGNILFMSVYLYYVFIRCLYIYPQIVCIVYYAYGPRV